MKILQSISKLYTEQTPLLERLQAHVDKSILSKKRNTWFYYSRIKSEESFALKLETGRFKNPRQLEDFFACTLVVENINEIKSAIMFTETLFDVKSRRPISDDVTHKDSSSFSFDDLRLYVSVKNVEYLPPSSFHNIDFEIQVKTFLQHAWSVATHDLIYKSDGVSWSKERVAFQIKAMLEQAEISISGADALSKLPELAKENSGSKSLNEIKNFLISVFPIDALPFDLLRLSNIVNDILKAFEINLVVLGEIVQAETTLDRGTKTLDLSPYAIIIQSIINQKPDLVEKIFKKSHKIRSKGILMPSEVSLNNIPVEDESKLIKI